MCSRVCGIGPSGATDHQDRPVHLRRPGDHVLDVVGVPRAVDVGVVALVGLVLDVGDGDGDAPLPLLRRVVDAVEGAELRLPLQRQRLGDRRRQGRLAVVDVPDRPHVHMRLRPLKLLLPHLRSLLLSSSKDDVLRRGKRVSPANTKRGSLSLSPPNLLEPTPGLEPGTSFLPRMCSTS